MPLVHANPMLVPTIIGCAIFFWIAMVLERRLQSNFSRACLLFSAVVLACPALLYALYYFHLFDNAAWFYNVRTMPYTELLASGLGLGAGELQAWWQPETFGEKAVVPSLLFALVFVPFAKPLLDPLDLAQLKDRFDGEVCLQSTFSTCGPASAVTLLKLFADDVSEKQLAIESFTSRGGTEIWYLSRALRRRGIGTRVVIHGPDDPALPSPAIAGVLLPGRAGHFIAVLKTNDYTVTLADPLKGKLILSRSALPQYYRFTGFFLVLRRPMADSSFPSVDHPFDDQ